VKVTVAQTDIQEHAAKYVVDPAIFTQTSWADRFRKKTPQDTPEKISSVIAIKAKIFDGDLKKLSLDNHENRITELFNEFARLPTTEQDTKFIADTLAKQALSYPKVIPEVLAKTIKERYEQGKDVLPFLNALEGLSRYTSKTDNKDVIQDADKLISNQIILNLIETATYSQTSGFAENITDMIAHNLKYNQENAKQQEPLEQWDPHYTIKPVSDTNRPVRFFLGREIPADGLRVNVLHEAVDAMAALAEKYLTQNRSMPMQQTTLAKTPVGGLHCF
jgi:hypothetical protein